MWKTEYEVEGTGFFPFDMMRYDTSFPSNTPDGDFGEFCVLSPRKIRLCKVVSKHTLKVFAGPTVARWASFGWKVIKVGESRKF